ncbi:hypothetical protein ABIE44_003504 [Marmoricola sp. OAE513]|uniref:hypothetical protein n=1 Tax=Marmoricola sp. OAE513 TaxID=2817894 RepID=UPI001AE812DF
MSDDFDAGRGAPGPGGSEDVGSVGEEAAKLFAALSGWAKDQGTDYAGTAAGAAGAMSEALNNVNEHIATGGADCKYCPVCQVISVVRSTSPEVKAHLTLAASSLMQAAAGVLATQVPGDAKSSPVEKINLDESTWDES